ncbi:hypothetical protein D3C81_1311260 [compost metagenome]
MLLSGFRVAVPGDQACVALFGCGFVRQLGNIPLGQLRLEFERGGEAVRGEAVPDVATQPDDFADLKLDAHQAVGHVRYQVRAAAGECVAECGGTALQPAQLGPRRLQCAGLVGVAVA